MVCSTLPSFAFGRKQSHRRYSTVAPCRVICIGTSVLQLKVQQHRSNDTSQLSQVPVKTIYWAAVLVLAGVELIFSIVDCMRRWFGSMLGIVLITQRWFCCYLAALTQSQGLSCSSHHPTSEWAGGAQGVGRGHSWNS